MAVKFRKGKVYGRLTLVEDLGVKKGSRKFKCKCECGSVVSRRAYDVVNLHTRSCGCLNKELAAERISEARKLRKVKKADPVQSLYNRYKQGAARRELPFKLTLEQFGLIVKKKCAYCGIISKSRLNGVDRIDSSKGYIVGNVNPACKICNVSKWTLSKSAFLDMVTRIYKHSVERES